MAGGDVVVGSTAQPAVADHARTAWDALAAQGALERGVHARPRCSRCGALPDATATSACEGCGARPPRATASRTGSSASRRSPTGSPRSASASPSGAGRGPRTRERGATHDAERLAAGVPHGRARRARAGRPRPGDPLGVRGGRELPGAAAPRGVGGVGDADPGARQGPAQPAPHPRAAPVPGARRADRRRAARAPPPAGGGAVAAEAAAAGITASALVERHGPTAVRWGILRLALARRDASLLLRDLAALGSREAPRVAALAGSGSGSGAAGAGTDASATPGPHGDPAAGRRTAAQLAALDLGGLTRSLLAAPDRGGLDAVATGTDRARLHSLVAWVVGSGARP
ncbi:hypothetical protein [Clavibacter tessellarius]|uniref:hypothetical protein n=1 Tax=Clavibacter tessellarius TaxID=31965 RepID=UPI003255E437